MMHSGDDYEIRARIERHAELRRLLRGLTGALFRGHAKPATLPRRPVAAGCANDVGHLGCRAA